MKDPLELGKLLVRETMVDNYENTLAVWMAHYLAELIAKAELEGDSHVGQLARSEACSLVFKLWENRAELSGRANPMAKLEDAVNQLNAMDADGHFLRERPKGTHSPLTEFQESASKLFASMFLLTLPSEIATGDIAEQNLSSVEQKLIQKLDAERHLRFIIRFTSDEKTDPKEERKKELREQIARVREALVKLEGEVDAMVEAFSDDDDVQHQASIVRALRDAV